MKLGDVVKLIRGNAGTVVRLGVITGTTGEPKAIKITRAKIELKDQEARGTIIDEGKKQDGSPFFVWYAPMMPHQPHNPPDRLLAHYKDKTPSSYVAKYWAMIDVCQPGTIAIPKSHPTMEWTDTMTITISGVMIRCAVRRTCHCVWLPRQPNDKTAYTGFRQPVTRSRAARSCAFRRASSSSSPPTRA